MCVVFACMGGRIASERSKWSISCDSHSLKGIGYPGRTCVVAVMLPFPVPGGFERATVSLCIFFYYCVNYCFLCFSVFFSFLFCNPYSHSHIRIFFNDGRLLHTHASYRNTYKKERTLYCLNLIWQFRIFCPLPSPAFTLSDSNT